MREVLIEFIERVWSSGEVDQADRFVAEEYTIFHDPGDPWEGQTLGREEFKERVRRSRAPFPDQRFEVLGLFEDDSNRAIAMTWQWTATHLGDVPGFRATGKRLHMSGATVYFFSDEQRLTGHWQVVDRLGVYRQLQANEDTRAADGIV